MQDIEFCKVRYPKAICKSIALQFLSSHEVAILELTIDEFDNKYHLSVIDEKHYKLVNQEDISDIELQIMNEQE